VSLDRLITHDLSAQIAALPRHKGSSTLPPRAGERYVTLHYSGVNYGATDHAGELRRILAEASYHLNHSYDGAYPDGLLYDLVVLSDGAIVRTRARPVQLWHSGNATSNRLSYAVHVMLGPDQDATAAQWAAVVRVFETCCFDLGIPRASVVGHCEWPRHDGPPRPSAIYTLLPEQSACPGRVLHARLVQWRAAAANGAPPPTGQYRVLAPMWISETPTPRGPVALGGAAIVAAHDILDIDEVRPDGYAHLRSAVGFLPIGGLQKL
jgi:N-acetylmuramoyl-L-alanine amidase